MTLSDSNWKDEQHQMMIWMLLRYFLTSSFIVDRLTKNLLVIEMKKSTSSEDDGYDLKKLSAFKKELSYKYAVFMRLRTNAVDPGLDILEFL